MIMSFSNELITSTSTFGSNPTFSLRSNPSENDAIMLEVLLNNIQINEN